jgi:tRNA nucleotidyltransferase (CCA-adding enzyme)
MRSAAILSEVLENLTPSAAEIRNAKAATREVISRVLRAVKSYKAKVLVGGSGAKNTQLRGNHDIDIFILFPYRDFAGKDSVISDHVAKALRKTFPRYERLHGSRDYFQTVYKGYTFEFIPILAIRSHEQAKNITDISPLHARFVNRAIGNRRNDVRLLKAFCKAQGIYGAESYIRGFSGYACEVLIIHYGSFTRLLSLASRWKSGTVLDPVHTYKNKDARLYLNKSKIQSPLILIDPVQPSRNVTAALNEESFVTFVSSAKRFCAKPSAAIFLRNKLSRADIVARKKKGELLLLVDAQPEPGKTDVKGASLYIRHERIKKEMSSYFTLKRSGWEWDEKGPALLWYILSATLPSPTESRKGPLVKDKLHAQRFRKAHRTTSVKRGRLWAKVPRRWTTPQKLLTDILSQKAFKKKLRKVRVQWT